MRSPGIVSHSESSLNAIGRMSPPQYRSRHACLNHGMSLVRTRSVSVSRAPGVIGRGSRNSTPALA